LLQQIDNSVTNKTFQNWQTNNSNIFLFAYEYWLVSKSSIINLKIKTNNLVINFNAKYHYSWLLLYYIFNTFIMLIIYNNYYCVGCIVDCINIFFLND